MHKNVGTQEAYIRIGVGIAVLLVALFTENPTVRIILAVIAAILAGTAFLRTCPFNTLLKRGTHEDEPQDAGHATEATMPEPVEKSVPSVDTEPESQEDEVMEAEKPLEDATNTEVVEEEEKNV